MDAKEAVQIAKNYIAEVFVDEQIANLGLEEVEFDDKSSTWNVTLGFSRPWDQRSSSVLNPFGDTSRPRSYKIVCIDDASKEVRSVKKWESKS